MRSHSVTCHPAEVAFPVPAPVLRVLETILPRRWGPLQLVCRLLRLRGTDQGTATAVNSACDKWTTSVATESSSRERRMWRSCRNWKKHLAIKSSDRSGVSRDPRMRAITLGKYHRQGSLSRWTLSLSRLEAIHCSMADTLLNTAASSAHQRWGCCTAASSAHPLVDSGCTVDCHQRTHIVLCSDVGQTCHV